MQGEWDPERSVRYSPIAEAGFSAIRVALLFGSAAVALALIATPMLDRGTRPQVMASSLAGQLDMTATGSVSRSGDRYVLRRSVLQSSPNAVCVIRANGSRVGDC